MSETGVRLNQTVGYQVRETKVFGAGLTATRFVRPNMRDRGLLNPVHTCGTFAWSHGFGLMTLETVRPGHRKLVSRTW